ncbi:unnamed protein product [Pocillopora meandrina]|uniref:Secreted protein n=1 Tax=Pocillopora meandrina TaxID=46732 RepID=A0AAU9Y198_9CNID|nr:unnamed protein product [Pocillopora meandrina]
MHKNALFKGRSTLVAMVTTAACSRPGASFSYKKRRKKKSEMFISLSQAKLKHYKLALCIFRGLRIAQIPMKEGAALGIWMICTRFEAYVCSYVG